jgi:hypothetical protein
MDHSYYNPIVERWTLHIRNTEKGPVIVDQTVFLRMEYPMNDFQEQSIDLESQLGYYIGDPEPNQEYNDAFMAEVYEETIGFDELV